MQIIPVCKQRPIAPMRHNVIYFCCLDPQVILGAFAAEWLPKELGRPEILRPDRQAVPAMIGGAVLALVLWPMLHAPAVTNQFWTARLPAGPERFVCHSFTLPERRKRARAD